MTAWTPYDSDADVIRFTIFGQAASKANSRKIVHFTDKITGHRRLASIKSDAAREFERDAIMQIPSHARQMLTGPVGMVLRVFYRDERSDLDESVVLDVLQPRYEGRGNYRTLVRAGVYLNDRQVRERHAYHGIDAKSPRVEIEVWKL